MKNAVEKIVNALVENKDAVEISEKKDGNQTVISVKIAESDMGKFIGREGKTVRAVRSVLYAASQKQKHRYVLEVIE